jgi:hypothetical protein
MVAVSRRHSRCIANLVTNAVRYAGKASLAASQADHQLTVTIDDDGPGIPPERREDVFKPFYRLDDARNLDESGTGLGLSIARDIARAHGGDVMLHESPPEDCAQRSAFRCEAAGISAAIVQIFVNCALAIDRCTVLRHVPPPCAGNPPCMSSIGSAKTSAAGSAHALTAVHFSQTLSSEPAANLPAGFDFPVGAIL